MELLNDDLTLAIYLYHVTCAVVHCCALSLGFFFAVET